jgi:hypothetical protein
MQPGDILILVLGLVIVVAAITPFFRKLTPTQASGVAFGVLLIAAPILKDYSLSLFGVSVTKDQASEVDDALSQQIAALNTRVTDLQDELPNLLPTAAPDQRSAAVARVNAAANLYQTQAAKALVVRQAVFGLRTPAAAATPAPAAP